MMMVRNDDGNVSEDEIVDDRDAAVMAAIVMMTVGVVMEVLRLRVERKPLLMVMTVTVLMVHWC